MLGVRFPDCGEIAPMKYTYDRPMKRAKRRLRRSDAKFVGMVAVVAPAYAAAPAYDFACDVAYVNDGDTLRCEDGTRVRFHAISARETDGTCSPGHPCSPASAGESKAALERLAGSRITCVQTGKSYERVTAICHNISGVEINCAMVRSGAAVVWDRYNRERAICGS